MSLSFFHSTYGIGLTTWSPLASGVLTWRS
ncbi:hypothetical protein A2U01_0016246 [Trifolium medium]|uniref:Uncharacterized protein n=1 Tax=Trifolium medium TaxID=97028 RepID=A0A392N6A2_9FABA|nr:hypothetical protein [Trifolium medium]